MRFFPCLSLLVLTACGKIADRGVPAGLLDHCIATDDGSGKVEASSKDGLRIVTDSYIRQGYALTWEPGQGNAGIVRLSRIDPLSHQPVELGFEVSPQPPSDLAPSCREGQTLVSRLDFNGAVVDAVMTSSYLLPLIDKIKSEAPSAGPQPTATSTPPPAPAPRAAPTVNAATPADDDPDPNEPEGYPSTTEEKQQPNSGNDM